MSKNAHAINGDTIILQQKIIIIYKENCTGYIPYL